MLHFRSIKMKCFNIIFSSSAILKMKCDELSMNWHFVFIYTSFRRKKTNIFGLKKKLFKTFGLIKCLGQLIQCPCLSDLFKISLFCLFTQQNVRSISLWAKIMSGTTYVPLQQGPHHLLIFYRVCNNTSALIQWEDQNWGNETKEPLKKKRN